MISKRFAFVSPTMIDSALRALEAERRAVVIGGGTWAVPNLANANDTRLVIDLRRLPLRDIVDEGTHLSIGACVTYDMLSASPCIVRRLPLLARMAAEITGGPQIRGRGTLGGSACYANPSSDAPACLLALDASFVLASTRGMRTVAAADFFTGAFESARRDDEILIAINIPPLPDDARVGYHKLKICEGSWPIATAACIMRPVGDGMSIEIGVGAVSPTPFLSRLKVSNRPEDAELRQIARSASELIPQEWRDELAGPGYRRAVAPAVIETALRLALEGSST